eukprot:7780822-Pyramimonas_sp.AAC.1
MHPEHFPRNVSRYTLLVNWWEDRPSGPASIVPPCLSDHHQDRVEPDPTRADSTDGKDSRPDHTTTSSRSVTTQACTGNPHHRLVQFTTCRVESSFRIHMKAWAKQQLPESLQRSSDSSASDSVGVAVCGARNAPVMVVYDEHCAGEVPAGEWEWALQDDSTDDATDD